MCDSNVSLASSHTNNRPAVLIDLGCSVIKSQKIQWKLNDLRTWTIDKGINRQTTPSNRTFIYNITVTCEAGANISLPWPMKVAGLTELHVTNCRLLDKFSNFNDPADRTIDEDMKVLEIRHSTWVHNFTDLSLMSILQNLTSEFDCGQDSSLETMITSNVSSTIIMDRVDFHSAEDNDEIGDYVDVDLDNDFTNGPAKPEDRLIKDTTKVVSDHSNVKSQETETSTAQTVPATTDSAREEEKQYGDMMRRAAASLIKCNFNKLKIIDESISPVTSKDHFSLMVQGAQYPVLEKMNYSYFGLQTVPSELTLWRLYFPKLKFVDLSRNVISEIQVEKSNHVEGADPVTFDLRYNNFTTISTDMLKSWADDADNFRVDIRENPIHCGCDMAELLPHLADSSTFEGKMAAYSYVKDLRCYTPAELSGRQLSSLTADSLQCPVYKSNDAIVIALCVIIVVLIITLLFIIKFKVEIRILLYTRLHVRLPCDSDIKRHGKTFDAFVSYSSGDSEWVRENVLKFLENTPSKSPDRKEASNNDRTFRLCVHQRDFIPGKTIFDNIVDSIQASRHTIIVLSPNFIRSQWSMEELRQAYKQSLMERNRHLIVILLEKVKLVQNNSFVVYKSERFSHVLYTSLKDSVICCIKV